MTATASLDAVDNRSSARSAPDVGVAGSKSGCTTISATGGGGGGAGRAVVDLAGDVADGPYYSAEDLPDASFRVALARKHVSGVLGLVVAGQTTLLVGGNLRLFGGMQRVANLVGHLLVASSLSL